jgi:2-polyprenyl-3-methyl-5-hydroxy-6-metoxy-1,4-benzoquinol methylase
MKNYNNIFVHSKTYKKRSLFNIGHQKRLAVLIKIFKKLSISSRGKVGDFGCSEGYILNLLSKEEKFKNWKMYGFDHIKEVLEMGRSKFPHIYFEHIDLNEFSSSFLEFFDITTCFETLEHTGNYRIAFETLYRKTCTGGFIIISVPNELFLSGAIKFFGRYLRKNQDPKYQLILKNKKQMIRYIFDVLLNQDIEKYRKYPSKGFGPHLGFNYKNLENYIKKIYIQNKKVVCLEKKSLFLCFNKIYIFQKKHE